MPIDRKEYKKTFLYAARRLSKAERALISAIKRELQRLIKNYF